ncbi:MAG: Uma2 family endonuclease [Myxococcaceae bacterium]
MPRKRPAGYADLEAVPENLVGEIIDGELITSPRPAARHTSAASSLGGVLVGPYRFGVGGPGGWIILDEPELRIHGNALVLDLAGWRRERMPELPDVAAFDLAPDWVCEVLSPSTAALDRGSKLPIYAQMGVKHAWLVDPAIQTLEILRLEAGGWRLVATLVGDRKVRAEPFDATELDLSMLWAR